VLVSDIPPPCIRLTGRVRAATAMCELWGLIPAGEAWMHDSWGGDPRRVPGGRARRAGRLLRKCGEGRRV
jgi:hypothetical protein